MSPRTEEQFEKIRHEKRLLIMETGLELFAGNGFDNTSISQIAKQANISKGLLYNYFESKEELLEAILNKGIDDMLEVFDPNKDGMLDTSEMEFFIKETFRILKENRKFWKLYWAVSFQPLAFKLIEKRSAELYAPLSKMMHDYFKASRFADPVVETYMFGALLDGIALNFIMSPDTYPIDKVLQELINRYCTQK